MRISAGIVRIACSVASAAAGVAFAPSVHAQYFSKDDGFTSDGRWQVQTELMPYAWMPGARGSLHFDNAHDRSVNFNSGIPSASTLSNTLRGALMGAGLVRYWPFSAEFE